MTKVYTEKMSEVDGKLYFQDRLINCPKCKDNKVFISIICITHKCMEC